MNKTLLAVAVALAYSVTPAWADSITRGGGQSDPSLTVDVAVDNVANDNSNNSDNRNQSDNSNNSDNSAKSLGLGSTAASGGATASSNFDNAFNTSKAIAKVELTRYCYRQHGVRHRQRCRQQWFHQWRRWRQRW